MVGLPRRRARPHRWTSEGSTLGLAGSAHTDGSVSPAHLEPLTAEIEQRWRTRFGSEEVEQLWACLRDIARRLAVGLPDFLPLGQPRLEAGHIPVSDDGFGLSLAALLSKVLLALALDFEAASDLSLDIYTSDGVSRLDISANVLRVLDHRGVRIADLPLLSGVAKVTIDNWLGSLLERLMFSGQLRSNIDGQTTSACSR